MAVVFDTGCLVLIWMVQLVVYPSFKYYPPKPLQLWHNTYTKRITIVVLPLMFGQLICVGLSTLFHFNVYYLIKMILVVMVWVLTFAVFVPLHNKIARTDTTEFIVNQLVNRNWSRTVLWTVIFGMTLWKILW